MPFTNSHKDELRFGRTEGGGQPIMTIEDEFGNRTSYAIDSPQQCKDIIEELQKFIKGVD